MEIHDIARLSPLPGLSLVRAPRAELRATGEPPPRPTAAPRPLAASAEDNPRTEASQTLRAALQSPSASLHFAMDPEHQRLIVTLVDDATGGVIRQYAIAQLGDLTGHAAPGRGSLLEAIA